MAVFNKFNATVEALAHKKHNLGTDPLKIMLSNTAPVAGNSFKADITEITAGNGYTAGGAAVTVVSAGQTGGVYKLVINDVVFTASGAVGPFRYPVLYNDGATNKELLGWWDYGTSISLNAGETFTIDADPATGVIQLT